MTSGDHDERNQPDGLDDEAPPEIPDISSDPPPSGPPGAAESQPIDPGLERRLSPPPKPRGKKRDPARSRTAPQTPVARSVPPPKPKKLDSDGGLEGAHLKAPSLPNIDQPASTQRSQTHVGAPAPPPHEAMGSEPLSQSAGEAPVVVPPRAPMGSQPPRPVSEPPRRASQSAPPATSGPVRPLSRPPPAEETNDAGWDDAPPPARTEPPPPDDDGQPDTVEAQQPATPSEDVATATGSDALGESETTAADGEPGAAASAGTEAEGAAATSAEAEGPPAQGDAASAETESAPTQGEPGAAAGVAESGSGEAEPTGDAPRPRMITVPDDDVPPETPPSGKSPIQVMKIIAVGDGRSVGAPPELADTDELLDDAAELDEAEVIPAEEPSDLSQKAPPPPKRKGPTPPPPPSRAERQAAKQRSRMESAAGQRQQRRPWWEELFGEEYHRSMTRLSDRQVKREANFIEESLGVAPGGVVLDLGCGAGYHAVELAHRGYGVVGYDLSLFQLALAAEVAQERGQKINFLQGDMREMAFEEMFDGIYCWNTTFGYFEEEKNFAVAQRIFKALRPGGMFLLDVTNRDFAVAHQPSQVWYEGDACVCMDDMSVDFITSRLKVKRSMIMDDGRTRECTYSVRLYALHELGKIFHDVGFRVTEASGHPATPGVFFGLSSPRIIILAQRP